MNIAEEDIVGREVRFAVHCPRPRNGGPDMHVVKEIVHTKDGKQIPRLRTIENYQRPYWVTMKGFQNHKDKKEWEELRKLRKFFCTQSDLPYRVQNSIGDFGGHPRLRNLARNQYLYGCDILSTTMIKQDAQAEFPDLVTPYSVASFDIETDVVFGSEDIIMATLSFKDRVVTAIDKNWIKGFSDPDAQLRAMAEKYIPKAMKERNINWEIALVDGPAQVAVHCFKRAHEWQPDFVAIWNINFDLPIVLKALQRAGIDPKDVFSDPSINPEYRFFDYKVGKGQKVTASGKISPKDMHEQWHTVYCPASFYFIDAMCAYKQIRTGEQEERSYGLDAILNKHEVGGKLKFTEADGLTRIEWHQFMQSMHKLEYVVYNVWDCVSMEVLDSVTNDLALTMPMFSGASDFCNFSSQPRRAVDKLHYFCLSKGYAIGSTSDEMEVEFDSMTLSLKGWIITLPAHLVVDNGLRIIKGMPWLRTNIRAHVGDLDVSASYPNGGAVCNISKETTRKEIIRIEGVDEFTQRMQGINLSGGHTNAVEICTALFGMPTLDQMLQQYELLEAAEAQAGQVVEQKEEMLEPA